MQARLHDSVLRPQRPGPGATVALVAPSGPVATEALRRAIGFLRAFGYRTKVGRHLLDRAGYLAGTDEDRAADINRAFADKSVDVVFVARGGYGSARLLGLLDYRLLQRNPKVLIGSSDASALQLGILARSGLISFYGPLAAIDLTGPNATACFDDMMRVICARAGSALFRRGWPKTAKVLAPGRAEGRLLGGCLCVFASLVGTGFLPKTEGSLLFLEDVNEPPYRIDRYLTQLELAGVLSSVAGVLLGSFSRCAPRTSKPSFNVSEVLQERFGNRPYPVVAGLPFGHISRKGTIPMGTRAVVDTAAQELVLTEAPCLE